MGTARWFALLAVMLSPAALALELLCEGETAIGGQISNTSFVFNMDEKSKASSAWTPEGVSYGNLEETQQSYRGVIVAPTGNVFGLTLDRYSGEIWIIRTQPPPNDSKASFWGTCRKAERKF